MLCAAAPMRMFSPHWGGCVSRWGLGLIGGPPRTVCLSTLHSHNSNSNNSDSNSNKEDVGVGDEEGAVSLLRVHVTQLQQEVAQLHTLVQSQVHTPPSSAGLVVLAPRLLLLRSIVDCSFSSSSCSCVSFFCLLLFLLFLLLLFWNVFLLLFVVCSSLSCALAVVLVLGPS
mgnify:CR=1 FL=1